MLMLADAQTTSWNVATGDWNVNANWTNLVPSSSSIAIIANGGMVTISASDMAQTMTLDIGGNGSAGSSGASGALLLSGGTLTVSSGDLTLGGVANGGAGGTGTLNLDSGTLTAQSINVTSNGSLNFGPGAGQTVTVNASISGLSGQTVTFNTAGIVVLNGVTDFGAVALNAGTLKVSADNALGKSTGGLTFNGGTLETSATFTTSRSITLGSGGGTFNTDSGTTLTVATVNGITGTGGLTKTGLGTLVVSNNSTYSGGTTIDAGILEPLDFHSLGSGSVMVNAGGTLLINTGVEPIQIGPLSGSGTVNLLADNGLAVNLASGVSSTFSGTLEGSPASNLSGSPLLILNGSGTLHLDGATTLLGVIMVVGGILDLDSECSVAERFCHIRWIGRHSDLR